MSRQGSTKSPGPIPIPLIVRSAFSIGRGTGTLGSLLARAAAHGLDALALTDRDNLYGAVAFLDAAGSAGIHPVLGAEVTPREAIPSGGERIPREAPVPGGQGNSPARVARGDPAPPPILPSDDGIRGSPRGPCHVAGSLVFLIREAAGYASLCRILSARGLAPDFSLDEAARRWNAGLAVLVREAETLARLHPMLPSGALYAALVRPARGTAEERLLRETARRLGRPLVGTIDVYLVSADEWETHRLLGAIREVELASRLEASHLAPRSSYLVGPAETFEMFADDPSLLTAARELAFSCRFGRADLPAPGSLFPKLPLPSGETAYDRLYRMAQDGLRRRYVRVTREITRRLAHELDQIDAMGFTDYFVVVGDICDAARARGIPTVGRGSGASSLVSYLLGITNVDPLRYRLTFERFFHRLRRDLPDLDIDLCWRRRDEVIRHVYETHGTDRVAMISTHNHYQARGAFREAAKGLGMTSGQLDRIARAIPAFSDLPLEEAIRSTALGRRLDLSEAPLPGILAAANRLIGLPHTLGIHCGGIVIGPGPLDQWVPLEMATKGIVVTQYEMNAVEAVGLVKIDLLGNRAISTIAETIEGIDREGKSPPDLTRLPDPDPETASLLARGDALGCFQLESPGMRNLLRMLATSDLDGTIAALSLIRPGPAGSGMKERFIRRAHGLEPTTYLHPSLEPLLETTHGVLLYEEDVICVASAIGGFDRATGDLLRRAIASAMAVSSDPALGERPPGGGAAGSSDPWRGGTMREIENRFIACAVRNGIDADVARLVWCELARFGSYAFCKAHASGYGLLAYQTAYLKAHHPGAFYAALLNNHQGMYPLRVHVADARRHGVPLALPCIQRSAIEWTWDGKCLRCGLGQVRGLRRRTLEAIVAQRARGAFEDLDDMMIRTGANVAEGESLILCGALDSVGAGPRPARLWRLQCRVRAAHPREEGARLGLVDGPSHETGVPWREFDLEERVAHEIETLEVALSAHPVAILWGRLERAKRIPPRTTAAQLETEGPASVVGWAAAARRVRTKRDEPMLFLTLEDETGLAECTLFPRVYARYGHLVRSGGVLRATGRVEAPYGAPTLNVDRLELIEAGLAQKPLAPRRTSGVAGA
jgi:DNA polymerase III alpha subunit